MKLSIVFTFALLSSCSEITWRCEIDGDRMFSVGSDGTLGGATKGCTCNQIREFTLSRFGKIDESAMKSDFGC